MLAFPNLRCWRYLIERGEWFNIQNPTHVTFFSWRGISLVLAELGLADVCRLVFWGGRPGFGQAANLVQYVLRWLGVGSDLRMVAGKPRTGAAGSPERAT